MPPPQDRLIDGADILPVLAGQAASPHEALYFYDTRKLVAVRRQRWKYYRHYLTDNAAFWPLTQGPFLFDLENDPNESYSLTESQPQRAAAMAALLADFEAQMIGQIAPQIQRELRADPGQPRKWLPGLWKGGDLHLGDYRKSVAPTSLHAPARFPRRAWEPGKSFGSSGCLGRLFMG